MQEVSLIRVLVLLIVATSVHGQCPVGCFCLAGYVTCSGLKSFPAVFPADTRSLSITDIETDKIPAGIFDILSNLESVEIYQGRIGKISTGAFHSLADLDLISLNELNISTIEPYAFSNITNIGTISIYMSKIDTIQSHAFYDIFALEEIKLFMLELTKIDSFAFSGINELSLFSFYTNTIGSLQPYAFSDFENVLKSSMYLNEFGYLGCGSIEALATGTYEHSFYSNSVNCSCDLVWIPKEISLKKYLFSNWCQVADIDEKVYWEDISPSSLQCGLNIEDACPSAATVKASIDFLTDVTESTTRVTLSPLSTETTLSVRGTTIYPTVNAITGAKTMTSPPEKMQTGKTSPVEISSAGPEHQSWPFKVSTESEEIFSQPIATTELRRKGSRAAGPPSETVTTTQTVTQLITRQETYLNSITSSKNTASDKSKEVVVSRQNSDIKTVSEATRREEPNNVLSSGDNTDANDSPHFRCCSFILLITVIVNVI